jgi:NADP-dependent 3-hydroxy acid dehydrogenase YdfG
MMGGRFKGKVVVITGASAGVGRACARAFASEGARLGLIARSRDALEHAVAEAHQLGTDAVAHAVDVSDASSLFGAAQEIERRFGPIDVWVNNAMVTILSPVWDVEPEEYRRVTEVSYLGYVYGTQAALRSMRLRDQGTIVQVGSALEYRSIPLQSAYCGAKAAIRGFTDSVRTELLHEKSNIRIRRCNCRP